MIKNVATLGEILLRLSTPGHQKLLQSESLNMSFSGAEANVAVALSNYGCNAIMISKVPDNVLGQAAINNLRQYGVNTEFIARGGDKLGTYYLETGSWARPSRVIYDRAYSAISLADKSEFDFDRILSGVDWFHTTGITPALSGQAAELTLTALKVARSKGITTSFDVNFRQKLWEKDNARKILGELCNYVDVYIGNIGHAELLLNEDTSDPDNFGDVCKKLKDKFGFRYIANTMRNSRTASLNDISGLLSDGGNIYSSKEYQVQIVDRVGSGDAFASGLIYALLSDMPGQKALDFAVAASALKHTIPGDFSLSNEQDVLNLMEGDVSGKVVR